MAYDWHVIGDLANRATRGPWSVYRDGVYVLEEDVPARAIAVLAEAADVSGSAIQVEEGRNNMNFIAACRAEVPAMIAEIQRLQLEIDELRQRG